MRRIQKKTSRILETPRIQKSRIRMDSGDESSESRQESGDPEIQETLGIRNTRILEIQGFKELRFWRSHKSRRPGIQKSRIQMSRSLQKKASEIQETLGIQNTRILKIQGDSDYNDSGDPRGFRWVQFCTSRFWRVSGILVVRDFGFCLVLNIRVQNSFWPYRFRVSAEHDLEKTDDVVQLSFHRISLSNKRAHATHFRSGHTWFLTGKGGQKSLKKKGPLWWEEQCDWWLAMRDPVPSRSSSGLRRQ